MKRFVSICNYLLPSFKIKTFLSCGMPKSKETERSEVHLMPEVFDVFRKIAEKEERSVKFILERFLIKNAEKITGKKFTARPKKAGRPKKQ